MSIDVDLPPEHVTIHDGIPVTTPDGRSATWRGCSTLPRSPGQSRKPRSSNCSTSPHCEQFAPAGRERKDQEAHGHALPKTRSELEAAFLHLCDNYGLPTPVMNAKLHGYQLDAYWPEHKLVAEIDSWLHHGTRAAFERDRTRDADLQARGIATVRFTDEQITNRQGWVASRLAPRFQGGSSSSRRFAA